MEHLSFIHLFKFSFTYPTSIVCMDNGEQVVVPAFRKLVESFYSLFGQLWVLGWGLPRYLLSVCPSSPVKHSQLTCATPNKSIWVWGPLRVFQLRSRSVLFFFHRRIKGGSVNFLCKWYSQTTVEGQLLCSQKCLWHLKLIGLEILKYLPFFWQWNLKVNILLWIPSLRGTWTFADTM